MEKVAKVPLAREYMNAGVHTVTEETSLTEAISLLLEHEISSAPVVAARDGRRVLVGYVSEHDCLEALSNELFYGTPAPPRTVGTIMRRHPVCVSPDTDLFTLASILVHHRMRHLPVVDGEELRGIISRRDILRALDAHYRDLMQATERRLHPPDLHQIASMRFVVPGR